MKLAHVKQILREAGYAIIMEKRLANDIGTQLKLSSNQVVNVYDNGNVNVQDRNRNVIIQLLNRPIRSFNGNHSGSSNHSRKVFVVYGHDVLARTQLEAMLRRWGLEPLILDQTLSEGRTIIEKLENYLDEIGFGIVLATPDDIGYPVGREQEQTYRARQNVVLEAGMLLAKLGRKKVAILIKQQPNMEKPSDIQGLVYIPFKEDLEKDVRLALAKEMVSQGFDLKISQL